MQGKIYSCNVALLDLYVSSRTNGEQYFEMLIVFINNDIKSGFLSTECP